MSSRVSQRCQVKADMKNVLKFEILEIIFVLFHHSKNICMYRDLGLESWSENKKTDFDFSATQSQSQIFKNNVEKTRDETNISTNLDLEDLPISQIRKPHRRIRKDNSQAEFKAEMKKRLESSESCLKWNSNNPPLLHYKKSTVIDNEKPQSKNGSKSQRSKRSVESSTKNEETKVSLT